MSPTSGHVPTRFSPVRRWRGPKPPPARLACVKHSASVRSEPGSNSQVHHPSQCCHHNRPTQNHEPQPPHNISTKQNHQMNPPQKPEHTNQHQPCPKAQQRQPRIPTPKQNITIHAISKTARTQSLHHRFEFERTGSRSFQIPLFGGSGYLVTRATRVNPSFSGTPSGSPRLV